MRRGWKLGLPVVLLALTATACPADNGQQPNGDTTARDLSGQVQDRGRLNCGVNEAVPGFGLRTPEGTFEGFDVDYCRAVAAAVLGDADAVDYEPLTAEARFTALQAGEIDVLIRNTTWTSSRDGGEGAAFAVTTFYDGQGMMVAADSEFQALEDMNDTGICVLSGTTTELNLETQFSAQNIPYEPLTFEDNDTLREAFLAGRCEGWTSDKSQLAAFKAAWPEEEGGPDGLRILDVTMSKEPLGPAVLDGDQDWYDAVNWAVIATIQAEEFEITSENVDEVRETSEDPEVRRFLGVEVDAAVFDPELGLPTDFAYQVVRQVGNYEEIYNRHVGPDTPLGLERGFNQLWTDGGLLYPPPYR